MAIAIAIASVQGPELRDNISAPSPMVERRHQPVHYEALDHPWTATRCHRLLRPLLSNVAALRKNAVLSTSMGKEDTQSQIRATPRKRANPFSSPLPSRKKHRHTYSNRGPGRPALPAPPVEEAFLPAQPKPLRQACQPSAAPGEIVVPTPVLKRLRGHQMSSPLQRSPLATKKLSAPRAPRGPPIHGVRRAAHQSPLEAELAALRTKVPSCRFVLYEAIFRGLDSLLRATSPSLSMGLSLSNAKPKSLLDICLRKVPQYVIGLELWEEDEAEKNGTKKAIPSSTTSFQVYSELESLGTAKRGWKHLRLAVRAHGVRIITDAIYDGLVDDCFARLLVRLCHCSMSYQEAEDILVAMTERHFPAPMAVESTFIEDAELSPLRTLGRYARETDGLSFMLRRLSVLLSTGLLPPEWLSTEEFGWIWAATARAVSSSQPCEDATAFVVTSATLLCHSFKATKGLPADNSTHQTLISALTALITMPILGHETRSRGAVDSAIQKINSITSRVTCIIQLTQANMRNNRARSSNLGAYLLTLSLFLSSKEEGGENNDGPKAAFEALLDRPSQGRSRRATWRQKYESTVTLVASVAQCCARGAASAPHTYLTLLCDRLASLDIPEDLFKNLRAEAAFQLANRTNDLRDLSFAESLDPRVGSNRAKGSRRDGSTNGASRRTPVSGKKAFPGYRWEEGISEWVTANPVMNSISRARHCGLGPTESSDDEDDIEHASSSVRLPIRQTLRDRTVSAKAVASTTTTLCSLVSDDDEPTAGTYTMTRATSRGMKMSHHKSWREIEKQPPTGIRRGRARPQGSTESASSSWQLSQDAGEEEEEVVDELCGWDGAGRGSEVLCRQVKPAVRRSTGANGPRRGRVSCERISGAALRRSLSAGESDDELGM